MAKFIQNGNNIDVMLAADTERLGVVPFQSRIGIATEAGKAGETVAVALTGVYEFPTSDATLKVGDDCAFLDGEIVEYDTEDAVPAGMVVAISSGKAAVRIG